MIIQDGTVKTRTPGIVHLLMMCIFFLQIKKKQLFHLSFEEGGGKMSKRFF